MTTIDVVIATHNRPERLLRCLDALAKQTHLRFGTIVVDDGSEPAMEGFIAGRRPGIANFTLLRTDRNSGPARARNLGVSASSADVICFIDDDVDADEHLLERHLAQVGDGTGRVVSIGPLLAPADWRPSPWNRWEADMLLAQYEKMGRGVFEASFRQFYTGNAALSRCDFLGAGGFDDRFTRAEDIELGIRLGRSGCRFAFDPEAIGWHYAHRSLSSWLNIPRQYARFDRAIDALYPEIAWLQNLEEERAQRNLLARVAGRGFTRLHAGPAMARLAVAGAATLSRLKAMRLATVALSLAFELEYAHAARKLHASGAPALPAAS